MKGLVKEGTRPYAYQRKIPERFRSRFDGKVKFSLSLETQDHDEAIRRAQVAERDFEALCGEDVSPVFNLDAIAGMILNEVSNRGEFSDIPDAVHAAIVELQDDGHVLTQGFPGDGPTFDKLVSKLRVMCAAVEAAFPNPNRKPRPVGRTLMEQALAWHALPSPLAGKTRDQYVNDAKLFQSWFVSATRKPCVGATITKKDVNAFVASRMKLNEPRATINRRLAGCAKIYKSGQFGDDNPFVGVSSRIDIHGPKLKVRPFTDPEVRLILKESREFDQNVQWVARIAPFSGMRLGEICSLRIEDLDHIKDGKENLYYWRLTDQQGRKLKNEQSYRLVPVHPSLIDDLLKYQKGRTGYLLDEPQDKYGRRSDAISKRLNRLIDRVTDEREAREHSYRHTVISKLADAGVREELRKALVGHAGGDPHDGYNHAMRIRELWNAIKLLEY